jgi:carbonic anhydrase
MIRLLMLSVLCFAGLSAAEHKADAHAAPAAHEATVGVSPEDALSRLALGNSRFVAGQRTISADTSYDRAAREKTAGGQHPFAGILTCADSRLSPEIIFDQHVGDLFVVRNAGNIAEPVGEGSLEYGVEHLGVRLIMVLGHTKCGAVAAVGGTEGALPGNLAAIQNEMPGLRGWVEQKLAENGD